MVDEETLSDWRTNYELHLGPHDLAEFWRGGVPAGAVLALKVAVEEIERLQAELAAKQHALKLISCCKSMYEGDVVDIARKALAGEESE